MEYISLNRLGGAAGCPADAEAAARFRAALPEGCKGTFAVARRIAPVIIDFDLVMQEGAASVSLAKGLGLPVVPCIRRQVERARTDFPQRLQLELTNCCNNDCVMCPRHGGHFTRKPKHMELDLVRRALDEIAQHYNYQLQLFHIGEPLLHPRIFEIFDMLEDYPTLGRKWISSKGQELTPDIMRRVLTSKVDYFNYSLLAMTPATYARIVPNGDYATVRGNLERLADLKRDLGVQRPYLRAQMIEMDEALHEIDAFLDTWADRVDLLSVNRLETFSNRIDAKVTSAIKPRESIGPRACKRLERGDLYILSNGEVTVCDTDFNGELSLGNLNETTLAEMARGARYRQIIDSHERGDYSQIELCRHCEDWNL